MERGGFYASGAIAELQKQGVAANGEISAEQIAEHTRTVNAQVMVPGHEYNLGSAVG